MSATVVPLEITLQTTAVLRAAEYYFPDIKREETRDKPYTGSGNSYIYHATEKQAVGFEVKRLTVCIR